MDERRDPPHLRLVSDAASAVIDRPRTTSSGRQPQLEIVRSRPASDPAVTTQPQADAGVQLRLFSDVASAGPSLLGFFYMYRASGESFAGLIEQIRPVWIFDLRPVAAFNLARFSRRRAFRLFAQYGVEYFDLNLKLELWDRRDPRIASGELAEELNRFAEMPDLPDMKGPIIFLVDDRGVIPIGVDIFPRTLRPQPRGGWQVHVFDHQAQQHV